MELFTTKHGNLYYYNHIDVPTTNIFQGQIPKIQNNSKFSGHPGQDKKQPLIKYIFKWPSVPAYIHRYVDMCDSCQIANRVTQNPFGTLEPLLIPAGPLIDISDELITELPLSDVFDSVLKVVDWRTKTAHSISCTDTMLAKQLANLILNHV